MGDGASFALQTDGLGIRFGHLHAVHGVTLNVRPGARQALIGPNGAGKTTLINLLTGVYRPTAGRIVLDGRDITHLGCDARARLGLVRTFQINTLFLSLTPLQSVVLAMCEREGLGGTWWRPVRSYPHLTQEALQLLQQLRLGDVAEVPVHQLAYGKQRLLEIALALAAKPRILLLDEPAAGIPQGERAELLEAVAALPAHISVLFIEHDMHLVFRFAQRISVLVAGQLLTEGSVADVAADARVQAVYLGTSAPAGAAHG